jgi:hypothetical protein
VVAHEGDPGRDRATPRLAEPRAAGPQAHPSFFPPSSDGKTWTSLPSTPYAETQLPSPGPGSYAFRAAATVGKTVVDWTPPFPLTIH